MKTQVTFDANAYTIAGQPTWLLSGEMHYYKMTRGDWRRRLVQLKCAGFNTVSVYMAWNYHEPEEGQWRFDGDYDVEYFLQLAAELGLYVVARPGPFICNEWLAGALPAWLSAKPGIRLRTNDPLYLSYVDKWWDRIAPLIAKYQLGAQGTIILAQVENEYGHFGEYQEPAYIYHLRDGLRSRGVEVPIIVCDSFINFPRLKPGIYDGINMCCNFGGDGLRILQRARALQADAPLFVTEYWIAAFDWWGRNGSAVYDSPRSLYGALEIAAGGAGGLTTFVFAGGAHFGYWHGRSICSEANFMTTLYGPGAPILDDGRFGDKYSLFKKHLSPLACAALASAGMPTIDKSRGDTVKITRRSNGAEFVFYQNRSAEQIRVADLEKDQACVDMTIPAGATTWTAKNLPLPAGFVLKETSLNIFRTDPALIVFGEPDRPFSLTIGQPDGTVAAITGSVPNTAEPYHVAHRSGPAVLNAIVLNTAAVDNCWTIDLPGLESRVIGGPERIEDLSATGQKTKVTVSSRQHAPVWVLRNNRLETIPTVYRDTAADCQIPLRDIKVSRTLPETAPEYDDSGWVSAKQPRPMASFGHGHGWAWYRAKFHVATGGPQMIMLSGAEDRAHVWVDGRYLGVRGWGSNKGWHIMPSLPAGEHSMTWLVENLGMFNSGAEFDIPLGEPKGLYGPVWLNGAEITDWRMRTGLGAEEKIDDWPQPGPRDWRPLGAEEVREPTWVQASFRLPAQLDGAVRLELGDQAGKGSCWLNGKNVGRYWNIGPQHSLWLPLSWLSEHNTLVLFEEVRLQPERVTVSVSSFGDQATLEI